MNIVSEQSSSIFLDKLKEYVELHKPVVYILTPCYGSMCYVNYTMCLIHTLNVLKQMNVQCIIEFCRNDSLVSRARNNLVAKAMSNKTTTHIMFIDTDITWDPWDILKLLVDNKPLIGGVYPLKRYNWSRLNDPNIVQKWVDKKSEFSLLQPIADEVLVQQHLLNYNINHIGASMQIVQNVTEVKHLATGFMMIQRSVIEKMSQAFPSTKYVDDVSFLEAHENEFAFALFDCGVEEGHYFSEDWLFCHRWRNMGGQVHVNVSINLTHSGVEDYKGSFMTSIL